MCPLDPAESMARELLPSSHVLRQGSPVPAYMHAEPPRPRCPPTSTHALTQPNPSSTPSQPPAPRRSHLGCTHRDAATRAVHACKFRFTTTTLLPRHAGLHCCRAALRWLPAAGAGACRRCQSRTRRRSPQRSRRPRWRSTTACGYSRSSSPPPASTRWRATPRARTR